MPQVSIEFLEAVADAFNRHDADAIMTFMTDDCVFEASAGADACGTRADGSRVEVHGCDVFTFRDGKIALKDSYRKNRPPIAAASVRS